MATSTIRYEFESDDATYIKTDNVVSMTMPKGYKTDEISDVYSCLARNPGNNLSLTDISDYVCIFFSYKQESNDTDGTIWTRIYSVSADDFTSKIRVWETTPPTDDPSRESTNGLTVLCDYTAISTGGNVSTTTESTGCGSWTQPATDIKTGQDSGTMWTAAIHNSWNSSNKATV